MAEWENDIFLVSKAITWIFWYCRYLSILVVQRLESALDEHENSLVLTFDINRKNESLCLHTTFVLGALECRRKRYYFTVGVVSNRFLVL